MPVDELNATHLIILRTFYKFVNRVYPLNTILIKKYLRKYNPILI